MWIERPRSNPDLGSSFVARALSVATRPSEGARMVTRSACAECASLGTTTCGHASIDAKGEIRIIRERLRRKHGIVGMGA